MDEHPEELLRARRFRVVRLRQQGPDGRELVRDTVQHPGAVAILPLVTDSRSLRSSREFNFKTG
jgi:hypothetical protein